MKHSLAVIGLALLLGLAGCDKAKSLVKQALRNAASEDVEVGEITLLTSSTYDDFEKQKRRLVVVDFYADWCGSCRKLEPILARVSNDFAGKAVVGKVNVARQKEIAKEKGMDKLPDIRFISMASRWIGWWDPERNRNFGSGLKNTRPR